MKEIIPSNFKISPRPGEPNAEQYRVRREIGQKLGDKGWLYPAIKKEYGGGSLSGGQITLLTQELEEIDLENPPYYDAGGQMSSSAIQVWATDEQKQHFLPQTTRGLKTTWLLLTEPHGGSDLASAKTQAIRNGDEYIVNGTKTWVGHDTAEPPDQFWTIVQTDPTAPRHQNLGFIIIPANLEGITIQPLETMERKKSSVFFEDVHVPAFNLIGGENNGWKVANTVMEVEHGGNGRIGKNQNMERFFEYVKSTSFNGQPISKDPDIRELLADIYIEQDVSRLFGLRNFWMRHARVRGTYEGSQSSFYGKMSGLKISGKMNQILGYFAVIGDEEKWGASNGWIEHYQRQAITAVHPGGTQDIQRTIIARRMGIGRTVKEEAAQIE
ncbi:MAG: hypothetical protein EXR50_06980 [Dehalococcoidia bacterium]|nr:hypothetical protein [Dehalococcoidia bacterium]